MTNQGNSPKPNTPENQPGKGLDVATCSRIPFDEECVWHFALRYALPRTSTASTIVSEFIRANMEKIDPRTLRQMAEEIEEAISRGNAGHAMDVAIWRRLADVIHSANVEAMDAANDSH